MPGGPRATLGLLSKAVVLLTSAAGRYPESIADQVHSGRTLSLQPTVGSGPGASMHTPQQRDTGWVPSPFARLLGGLSLESKHQPAARVPARSAREFQFLATRGCWAFSALPRSGLLCSGLECSCGHFCSPFTCPLTLQPRAELPSLKSCWQLDQAVQAVQPVQPSSPAWLRAPSASSLDSRHLGCSTPCSGGCWVDAGSQSCRGRLCSWAASADGIVTEGSSAWCRAFRKP